MIDMQLLDGALLALAVLVGAAIVLSVTIVAAARVARRSQPPHGGTRRDLPQHPQPDTDGGRELADDARALPDEARELMLV